MRNVLSIAELESEHTELLPVRETLTFGFGNQNWAAIYASNSSLALNAASLASMASSAAVQTVVVTQG
ncbi:hypothetical protein ASC64_00780 [Nocardioides sp. Root122]|uniref:hypothetical protein n=1 Tax=Nocardioides TaxID=1839 RepID=UPI00070294D8|nr:MULTISPECIES: hypothetical protein [Nocardioides]KQV77419.1 hypothetical protein ASC64_00780 [Nocardioides sp. Root122]MCK9824599.1 hypothetical protein [Nocardioides cavernae]